MREDDRGRKGMSQADEDIRKLHIGEVKLVVKGKDGAPLIGREVTIEQRRHKFLFGVAGFDIVHAVNAVDPVEKEQAEQRLERLVGLFNYVTLPFYWAQFEPARGHPQTAPLLKAARWAADHHLQVKGHPLCWHTLAPDWLLPLSTSEIRQVLLGRIHREVTDFVESIPLWDVLNEAVIMPVFDKYDNGITRLCREMGRIELIRQVFGTARLANPSAILLLNDFDMSPAFDILIEGCLEAGIHIDAIGLQSHMHQGYWGVEKTLRILDQFSRFHLPIHFTETTLVSGRLMPPEIVDLNDYQVEDWPSTPEGEARQREEVLTHYKTLLAQPLVEGITWWDLTDGNWLKAPAGLIRKDTSPKPAYEELMRLIKAEWWLPATKFITDEEGGIRFSGFLGEYEARTETGTTGFLVDRAGPNSLEVSV